MFPLTEINTKDTLDGCDSERLKILQKLFVAVDSVPLDGAGSKRLPASILSTSALLLCRAEETGTCQTNTFKKKKKARQANSDGDV